MKVMMVTPYFYPKVGGLENYALNIALGLKKEGHTVFIVTANHDSKEYVEEKIKGLRVIRLPIAFKLSNTPFNFRWRSQIKKIIQDEKPDVINPHTPVPYISDIAIRVAGRTPTVLTYHNDLVKESGLGKYLAKLFYVLLMNKTLRKADKIITTSEYYAKTSPYLAKHQDKLGIVPPGVDTSRFNTDVDSTWLKKKYPSKKIVLFVASMDKTHAHKGVDVLLKAVAAAKKKISNIQLVAVGKGDAIVDYQKLAKESGIAENVDFTGFVSDDELPRYYAGADVLTLPSLTSAEGFGMVIMEAAACGTPAIGSNIGGIPFAIKADETGLLAKAGSALNFSNKLVDLLSNTSMRSRLGEAGTKRAFEEYSWETQSEKTAALMTRATLPRVCLIHNVISPYRLPLFEEINQKAQLTVLFCKPITKDRAWHYNLDQYNLSYKILKGFSIGPVIFNTNVLSALRKAKFDVVITNSDPDTAPATLTAIALAKLRSAKILIWSEVIDENVHFFPALAYSDGAIQKVLRKILSSLVMGYRIICFKAADRFVAFSKHAKDFLIRRKLSAKVIDRTFEVVPLDQLPTPSSKHQRSGKTFLYIGYLIERKNVRALIEAFKAITNTDARLIIAGSGPLEASLKALAKSDRRILFTGYIEGQAKADVYASADVLVLPTLSDCWGLVINEAMHYGLSIICSDAAASIEIINKQSGYIVEAKNTPQLHDIMVDLISNQTRLRNQQNYNRNLAITTDTTAAASGFIRAVNEALV